MTDTPKDPGDDQRQHPRYAIELDAEIRAGELRVLGRTRDISRGGFCMQAAQPIVAGSGCDVTLALVFSENQFSEQLALNASVAWCTPVKGSFQIGVKFEKLAPQQLGYLDLFIKFLDEGAEEEEPAGTDEEDLP